MKALKHSYPQWDGPPRQPDDGYPVWLGHMRIVRSRKRMRTLKRRGVPMLHLGVGERAPVGTRNGPWAWFETDDSVEARKFVALVRHAVKRGGPTLTVATLPAYTVTVAQATAADKAARRSPKVTVRFH